MPAVKDPPKAKPTTDLSVTVTRAELVRCLESVIGAVKPRTPNPILQCVKIATDVKSLTFEATNFTIWIRVSTAHVQINNIGAVAVDCARLLDASRMAGGETVELVQSDNSLSLVHDAGRIKFQTQDVKEFPRIEGFDIPVKGSVDLAGKDLRESLAFADHAADKAETKHGVKGVLFERAGNRVTCAATDDHRLAVVDLTTCEGEPMVIVIPNESVRTILKTVDDEAVIKIASRGDLIELSTDDLFMRSSTLERGFPNYRKYIPTGMTGGASLPSVQFCEKVRLAALGRNETTKAVTLKIQKGKGVGMSCASSLADSVCNVPCLITGNDITVMVNADNLVNAIEEIGAETVQLEWTDPNHPLKLTATGTTRIVVLLPINIIEEK